MSARKFDQFYTKESVVRTVLGTVNLNFFQTIIEPSSGDGSFVKLLVQHPNLLYVDIDSPDPAHRFDFLLYNPSTTGNVLVVGNVPFGRRCSLAVKFFNHAAIMADTIAFIVPKTFQKNSIQNRLDMRFHLVVEHVLPLNSFLLEGEEYNVATVWQIWEKRLQPRQKIEKLPMVEDFKFCKRGDTPDIAIRRVGVLAGRIFETSLETRSEESHLFLKVSKNNLEKLRTLNLESCEEKYQTVSNPCISKNDILKNYKNTYSD